MNDEYTSKQELNEQRWELLHELEDWLEIPMIVLGFVWLALLTVELIWGLHPLLETLGTAIWILFVLDFLLRFTLAPGKIDYLQSNWLTAIALLMPALRVFRIARVFRVLRATRGLRLVRIVTSLNRGMRVLSRSMGRRGFGYVVALTFLVTLVGAAGMYAFENLPGDEGLSTYGEALWWTAMIMTTMGSEYWPQTPEGRILAFILAMYAFAMFGYVTASIASFFISQDAESPEAEVAGEAALRALQAEIAALREEVRVLAARDQAR